MAPKGFHQGKIMAIDTVSQNRLKTIKKYEISQKFENIGSTE